MDYLCRELILTPLSIQQDTLWDEWSSFAGVVTTKKKACRLLMQSRILVDRVLSILGNTLVWQIDLFADNSMLQNRSKVFKRTRWKSN